MLDRTHQITLYCIYNSLITIFFLVAKTTFRGVQLLIIYYVIKMTYMSVLQDVLFLTLLYVLILTFDFLSEYRCVGHLKL